MYQTLYALQPTLTKFRRAMRLTIGKEILPPTPIPGGRMSNGFIYVLEGECRYDFADHALNVKAEEILFLPKGSVYGMEILSDRYEVIFANFDLALPEDARLKAEVVPAAGKHTENLFQKLLTAWHMHSDIVYTECLGILYAVYTDFLRATFAGYTPSFKRARMEKAILYINGHLTEPTLSIPEIAASIPMSDGYFRKQFKEVYGVSPIQYIHMRQIALIKEDLRYSTSGITQIAEKYGFSDIYYFCHLFRKEVGCSPGEYRKRHKNDSVL